MSANIKVSGKIYNGIETISVKDTSDAQVNFLLYGVTPSPVNVYKRNDVTFFDYDGSIVISYTKTEFLALLAMPANPIHTNLISEGWNWTLADAKNYVASYGMLNIGQMYHTASGKTEYDIDVNEASGMTERLRGSSGIEKDWGDGTIDTLESHTYTSAGNYTIKLSGTTLPSVINSKKVHEVRIASSVTSIADGVFSGCRSLRYITLPNSVTSIVYSMFYGCFSLQSVTIPSGVTSIGNQSFTACGCLQSVTIPSSVTSISAMAFDDCRSLQSVTIPGNVTSINSYVFHYCRALQSITIPNSVISINGIAFDYCNSLQSVTIPSSVTSIGNQAFYHSDWLAVITVLATTPPTLASDSFAFNAVTKIYIPHGTLATYTAATNWSIYESKFVELPA